MPKGVARTPEPREWILMKACKGCGERKPWALYSPHVRNEDGSVRTVYPYCRRCHWARTKDASNAWRVRNRERRNANERARRARLSGDPKLPVGPFQEWLDARAEELGGYITLAECVDVHDRTLRRIRDGEQETVRLSLVDRCCVTLGFHLSDVYPDVDAVIGMAA